MGPPHFHPARRRRRALALLSLVAVMGASCGDSGQSIPEWRADWDAVVASIPDRSAFAAGPDETLCSETLVTIREAEASLLPTPSEVLDDPVRDWLQLARETFFECPPRSELEGFDAAYDELDALLAEVDAGLTSIGG